MKLGKLLTASALASLMTTPAVMADNTVTPDQKKQFEQIIHDYLVSNPEVLMEASQALQAKQQASMEQAAKSAISKDAVELLNGKLAVAGNPNGAVTIVEFFDYQCGHCKKMKPVFADIIAKNPNVRVVYKEFPIFGKNSDIAAKAALAAAMQGKYMVLHDALLQTDKPIDEKVVMDAAAAAGLNIAKLKVDMESKPVTDELAATRKLAESMHLMGTPAIVVMATPAGVLKAGTEPSFIPGGTSTEALQALVDKATAAGK